MHYFQKFKTYLQPEQEKEEGKQEQVPSPSQGSKLKSADSYELIMMDILDDSEFTLLRKSSDINYSNEYFQNLQAEEPQQEEIQNMYMKDFIFLDKLEEARELTVEEWRKMIEQGSLTLAAKKNIYFSVLKGIKFQVRKKVWELFANTPEMKKLTKLSYKELVDQDKISPSSLIQIDKDVPRSKPNTKFLKQLRNILIGYCALTGNQYTQGMNLIAGSLLNLLALENDEELTEFEIVEKQFQERVFWVFIGVMVWKNWENIFDRNMEGLTAKLKILEELMIEHVPAVYQKLIDFGWDLTIFSQYYITIMLYNTPLDFSKIILDLFFLDGQNALHSLILRMMKVQEDRILSCMDEGELMAYFKKDIIMDCYTLVMRNQLNAKKLEDFEINFLKVHKN